MRKKLAKALKIGEFIKAQKPSYAAPDEVMRAHGETFADIKYDGYRVQIHKSKRGCKIYTRNSNELNYECYPEIIQVVKKLPECIIEAEMIGQGKSHKEVFDNMRKRFRRPGINQESLEKYLASGIIKGTPLSLRVFDTLRFEKTSMSDMPLKERRVYTEKFDAKGISPSETQIVTSLPELESLLIATYKDQQEGRVCKNPNSLYVPGARTIDWVKFKKSEPLDLAVVGFYNEKAYGLDLPFTGVLCATVNKDTGMYETIGKISTTRNGLADEINGLVKDKITNKKSSKVVWSDKLDKKTYKKFNPDFYIEPEDSVVLQIKAMNLNLANNWHTCSLKNSKAYSMRIGFAEAVRYDKNPEQATSTQTVRVLYGMQENGGEDE
jgi:ATP-dependent DNA ligase